MEFFTRLFDPSGFVPRANCGLWTPGLIWMHNASDFFIWTAYLAIPLVLVKFAYHKRHELPFSQLFWLFGLFIFSCGTTHLMDIVLFYNPVYRLAGFIKLITAAASWGTVLALFSVVPRALTMRSPEVLSREIEERNRVEAELRVRERQLSEAQQLAHLGSWEWDIQHDTVTWSDELYRIYGLQPQEIDANYDAYLERVHPDDREAVKRHLETALREVKPFNFEESIIQPNGTQRYLHSRGQVIGDENGKPILMRGICQDVTERKQLEDALWKSYNLLRAVTESSSDAIFAKNREGQYVMVNSVGSRLLGKTPGQIIGKDDTFLLLPEKATKMADIDQQVIANGSSHSYEDVIVHDDKEQVFLTTKSPMRNSQSHITGLVGVSRDITELKQMQAQMQAYAAQLEHSNQDLQDFASVASHDLQEPLRKIQMFSSLLETRCASALPERGIEYLNQMKQAATRMETLIRDLLTLSRVSTKAQPFQPVDLNRIAQEVTSDLEARIQSTRGRVEVSHLPTLEGEPLQMRQLFQNLIGNALKFHKEGEPPHVSVTTRSSEGSEDQTQEPGWQITVQDNGIGIEAEYLNLIFAPFQRLHTRSQYEGTGIGLAICRKIVERHGGTITVHSTPGSGSTFTIILPARQPIS